jgi:hypothetical protein
MDGQSGCNCAANSSFASTLTETDSDFSAATSPNGSAQAKAAVPTESLELFGRFLIYPRNA